MPVTLETIAAPIEEFVPRRFMRNGHLQTVAGNYLPRASDLTEGEVQMVEVSPAGDGMISSQVLCHCHWQPVEVRATRPTAIIVHGLEGSSNSQYVVGNSTKLWHAGCNIVRMNMRNCNGTESLSSTLYHSGLSNDVMAVMKYFVDRHGLQSVSLIGYSMGGNLVLKLVGELGSAAPRELHSAIGISPAVDLGPSADALHRPINRLYEMKFLHALLRRYRRKASLFPHLYDPSVATRIRSLREFDDRVTALYAGFSGADDYYYRAAAARVLDRIAVPTLILHAIDDPFVRITDESREMMRSNPNITLIETEHGGHCAFLAEPDEKSGYDGYWAEHTLLRFLLTNA
jgi:uncharacterized protein